MAMQHQSIWKPIAFDPRWNDCKTEKFDNIYPSWEKRRALLNENPAQYTRFIDQLKRKQAIDTGILERMYDLKKGVTETFIKEGFVDSYLQHGDTDIAPNLLMHYLKDNFEAIDFIFDFVKNDRQLSISYIKELHALITQHQDTTEAIDQFGNQTKMTMLKGAFKVHPNNPSRDGTVFDYCPPAQVASEMDNLIALFATELQHCHVLVKAAFLHHAFVQIHPFQDGNGRLARLLASFVLIKEGLFPLTIDREDRTKYIDALELADQHNYQALVDVFANNQIISIERALNWKIVDTADGYERTLAMLRKKLSDYDGAAHATAHTLEQMRAVFAVIQSVLTQRAQDLGQSLAAAEIEATFCAPADARALDYTQQLVDYADAHDYYFNLSLPRCWGRIALRLNKEKTYHLILSLHHYGYDNSTFALGGFLSKVVSEDAETAPHSQHTSVILPLEIPPLTMSSEKDSSELESSITQQVEDFWMTALAYIANEL